MLAGAEKLIKSLELELLQPAVRLSSARLSELLADDFLEIGQSGKTYTKREAIDALLSQGELQFTMHDFVLTEVAPRTVQAVYRVEMKSTGGGESRWSGRSSIWQLRDGRWQIVFHQGTPIPPSGNKATT